MTRYVVYTHNKETDKYSFFGKSQGRPRGVGMSPNTAGCYFNTLQEATIFRGAVEGAINTHGLPVLMTEWTFDSVDLDKDSLTMEEQLAASGFKISRSKLYVTSAFRTCTEDWYDTFKEQILDNEKITYVSIRYSDIGDHLSSWMDKLLNKSTVKSVTLEGYPHIYEPNERITTVDMKSSNIRVKPSMKKLANLKIKSGDLYDEHEFDWAQIKKVQFEGVSHNYDPNKAGSDVIKLSGTVETLYNQERWRRGGQNALPNIDASAIDPKKLKRIDGTFEKLPSGCTLPDTKKIKRLTVTEHSDITYMGVRLIGTDVSYNTAYSSLVTIKASDEIIVNEGGVTRVNLSRDQHVLPKLTLNCPNIEVGGSGLYGGNYIKINEIEGVNNIIKINANIQLPEEVEDFLQLRGVIV